MTNHVRISGKNSLDIAFRRATRELGLSMIVLGVFTSGFSAWIMIPSIGTSLQANLISYANGVATYMAVQPNAGCESTKCYSTIPQEAIRAISSVQGVQAVYPFAINSTYFVARNFSTVQNGQTIVIPRARFGVTSAVFGGSDSFPPAVLSLSAGRLPGNESSFVYQSYVPTESNFPQQVQIGMNKTSEVVIGCFRCPTGNITTVGPYFNATGAGTISSNYLFDGVAVMWNSTFMLNLLGPKDYNETFGPAQANYMIVKVDNVADVPSVAAELGSILKSYPPYQLYYDQAFAENAESFVTQAAPLYQALGLISLVAVVAVTFFISHLAAGKRSWEAGVLLTQGWGWGRITLLHAIYFLFLSLISFAVAAVVSLVVSPLFTANYVVYGQSVSLTASADPFYLITGLALALLTPIFATWTMIKRLKRTGLDKILREY
jgi:ABC-type lipoprotein release transport system permease subunit